MALPCRLPAEPLSAVWFERPAQLSEPLSPAASPPHPPPVSPSPAVGALPSRSAPNSLPELQRHFGYCVKQYTITQEVELCKYHTDF